MLDSSFRIKSFMTPGISVINNITYVVPGWHIVPAETTIEEVLSRWERDVPESEETHTHSTFEIMIDSSAGDKQYKVSFKNGIWNCDCVGFGFRRKCKHCDLAKTKFAEK